MKNHYLIKITVLFSFLVSSISWPSWAQKIIIRCKKLKFVEVVQFVDANADLFDENTLLMNFNIKITLKHNKIMYDYLTHVPTIAFWPSSYRHYV